MMELEPIFAPRREKYSISTNTLSHLQNEHKGMFIEYNRELIKRFVIEERPETLGGQKGLQESEEVKTHITTEKYKKE